MAIDPDRALNGCRIGTLIKKLLDDRVGNRCVNQAEVVSEPDWYLLSLKETHQRLRYNCQLVPLPALTDRLRAVAHE